MESYKKSGKVEGNLNIDGNLILEGDLNVEKDIEVSGYIDCSGYSIEAGNSIKAGSWIEAGSSIKAGSSMLAQLHIKCKTTLSAGLYIYAGVITWRERDPDEDSVIECGKLEKGKVEFGILKELS